MKRYRLSAAAEMDMNEVWEYIAQDNIGAADHWIGVLFDAFESLTRNPGIGHRRQDLTSLPVYFLSVAAYLIVYRVVADWVEIVAVTQGSRDIPAFLSQRHP